LQDGDLTLAVVNGVTTTFSYDGAGNRVLMSVAGEVTTYTVDYGGNIGRVLFKEGSHTKHYIYGYACPAE
jgi:YD repeat-containing protein